MLASVPGVASADWFAAETHRVFRRGVTVDGFDPARAERAADLARDFGALTRLDSAALGLSYAVCGLSGNWGLMSLGIVAGVGCRWWYRRRFGVVLERTEHSWRFAGVGLAFAALGIASFVVDDRGLLPFSCLLLVAAAGMVALNVVGLARVGATPAHWAVCAGLVVAALVPAAEGGTSAPSSGYVGVVAGAVMIVIGLVDHVRLVRALPPAPVEQAGAGATAEMGAQARMRP